MKNEVLYLKQLKNPEVTTSMLMGVLHPYVDVRKKISSISKKGLLKPVKQGVYLVSEDVGLRPYSKEILANLICGPSYISLETALAHYGFIPERVESTTSVSLGRGRHFSTPVGEFYYHHMKKELYAVGVTLNEVFPDTFCLYACAEKALLDFVYIKEFKKEFKNAKEYFQYMLDSYRFDLDTIESSVSLKKLQDLSVLYPYRHVHWFADELTRTLLK
jgi:hypothetical protein